MLIFKKGKTGERITAFGFKNMEVIMPSRTHLRAIFVTLLLAFTASLNMYGQEATRTIGKFQYGKFSGNWFTLINDGKKGDMIDTTHIILRQKNGFDARKFNFDKVNLPILKDVRGKLTGNFYEFEIPKGVDALEVLELLNKTGEFEDVFFNVLIEVESNDPKYSSQWNIPKVQAQNVWSLTTGSSSVIVAVIDVGADYNHEDLISNKWSGTGYDFYDQDSDPYPYDGAGHGTCVAGIIAAATNNSLGIAGIAGGWGSSSGVKLMHLRAGYRYYDNITQKWREVIDISAASQAVGYAASNGAKVINMSFGGFSPLPTLESAINNAVNNYNVVAVASAGNYEQGQSTSVNYPAAYSNVVAVGATTENDLRKSLNDGTDESYWGSCYGSQLWITAPGIHVRTTDITGSPGYDPTNYYDWFNGTSAAAPHISAIVALMRSINPSLAVSQIRGELRYSADKVSAMGGNDWTSEYGYGRINANNAVHNLYVPQVYSTVQNAVNVATSGQNIIVSGTTSLSSNVSIVSGVTLTIKSISTINLNGHSIISTGGTITKEAGATINGLRATLTYGTIKGLFSTIQSAIDAAPQNYVVEIQNGTFNENITVYGKDYITILSAGQYSTYLTGTQQFYFCNNLDIEALNCQQINAYYCNNCRLINNIVSEGGIGLYSCTNFDCGSDDISSCSIGLNAAASSGYEVYTSHSDDNTSISSSNSANVHVYHSWFCEPVTYDFSATSSGHLDALDCYFVIPGHPVSYTSGGGTVTHSGDMSCVSKISNNTGGKYGPSAMQIKSDDSVETEFSKVNTSYFTLLKTINEAEEKGISGNEVLKNQFLNIAIDFKNFIDKNPQSSLARVALTTTANSFGLFDDNNGMKSFLDEIINDEKLASLKGNAENLMIDYYSNIEDYDNAISTADASINNYKSDDQLLCEGLLKKGLILSHKLKQQEKAIECFSAIVNSYPDNSLAEFAKNQLEELGVKFDEPANTASDNNEGLSTSSYPNPFNPTTIINYTLPENERVVIKVYDILGREVKELVNEQKAAGTYSVELDGGKLSSGVYFYTITAGRFSETKKMMLTK